jgi:O-antigen/teichoic acid export membrane protein
MEEGSMTPSDIASLPQNGTSKRKLVKDHGSTLIGQGLLLGLGFLTGALAARILGPVGRGEYQAVIIWPTAIAYVLSVGLNQAITFHTGRRTFTVSEIVTGSAAVSLVQSACAIAVGLVVMHFALAHYSHSVRQLGMLFVLFTPLFMLSGYPANLAQGVQNLLQYNLLRTSAPLTYLAGLVAIFLSRRGDLRLVLSAQVVAWLVFLIFGLAWTWVAFRPRFKWNPPVIPQLLHYGCRSQATNLASYFNQRIDQLILSLFVPPQQLGFYAVAVTLSTTVTVFPQSAGIVTFSRGSNQQSGEAKSTIGSSFRASLLWLLVTCSLLYAFAPFLIRLVFGAAFDGSILACRILLPGALMIGLNQVLYNGANALGRPGLPSIAEGIGMLVTAAGLYLMIPRYGYIGAAIVSSAAYTISFVVMMLVAHRALGLRLRDLILPR